MRWEDERWVKLYTRDTGDWLSLSFEAQGLLTLLFRKVDGAGILHLGRKGRRALAGMMGHPHRTDAIDAALEELLEDGCVALRDEQLVIPNFVEAQESKTSDKEKKRRQRERDRDIAMAEGFVGSAIAADIMAERHRSSPMLSPEVTDGHRVSPEVTACPQPEERDKKRREEKREDLFGADAPPPAKPAKKPKPEKPTNPRHAPMLKRLETVFAEERGRPYRFDGGNDAKALAEILAREPDDAEIERRYRIGLGWRGFPACHGIRDLNTHFNAYATPQGATGPPRKPGARVGAEETNWNGVQTEVDGGW